MELESLKNDLFENFKEDEISQLNKILGGSRWTNEGSDFIGDTGGNTNDFYETVQNFSTKGMILRGYIQPS